MNPLDRRQFLAGALGTAALSLLPRAFADSPEMAGPLLTKPIPSTGERLPVVGLGTDHFNDPTPEVEAGIKEVLRYLPILGGKVVDSAESYGEDTVGRLTSELGNRGELFLATKVGVPDGSGRAAGMAQLERSFRRLRTAKIDLIAVHNLWDTEAQLANLRELKRAGRIRYLGITTSRNRQHEEFERVMRSQPLDFIQVNYAIDNRDADRRILPLAAEKGIAVMANVPLGSGRTLRRLEGKPLPDWAADLDCRTWGQFLLKYVVSHPAVTCAIPGTTKLQHLRDDLQAAHGRLPDAALRRRMVSYVESL